MWVLARLRKRSGFGRLYSHADARGLRAEGRTIKHLLINWLVACTLKIKIAKGRGADVAHAQELIAMVLKELENKNYEAAFEYAGRCSGELDGMIGAGD